VRYASRIYPKIFSATRWPVDRDLPSAGGLAAHPVHADRGEVERVFALAERLGSISEVTSNFRGDIET
jgi:hypothetical protein